MNGLPDIWRLIGTPVTAALVVLGAIVVHRVLMFVLSRLARTTNTDQDEAFLEAAFHPLRWIMVGLALLSLGEFGQVEPRHAAWVTSGVRLVMPLLWGWMAIALIGFVRGYVAARSDIAAPDNLHALRRRTRADILSRIATIIVVVIALGLLLLKIPEVREIGVALVASAGIAGLAFGIAAQPLLKNLVAGIQLAFTEPVRIDDVVVYAGEWGRVEKITLTYVVLRIWDDRRLVIPVSKFLEDVVENWTRETSHLLGFVMVYVDPAADVPPIRKFAVEQVRKHPLWDGRVAGVQATDASAETLHLRILMSGRNGSELFDLRCDVREAVMRHIADHMPGAVPRSRLLMEPVEPSE